MAACSDPSIGNGACNHGTRTAKVVLRSGIMDIVVPLALATLIMSSWAAHTHADSASDPGMTLKSCAVDRERLLVAFEESQRRQHIDLERIQRVTLQEPPLESGFADGNRVNINGAFRAASSAETGGTEERRRGGDGLPESSVPVSGEAWQGVFSGQLGGLGWLHWAAEAHME